MSSPDTGNADPATRSHPKLSKSDLYAQTNVEKCDGCSRPAGADWNPRVYRFIYYRELPGPADNYIAALCPECLADWVQQFPCVTIMQWTPG